MYEPVSLDIVNTFDHAIENRPFTVGVPFKQGVLNSESSLFISCRGERMPTCVTKLASWKDGSIKWALLDFQLGLRANEKLKVLIENDPTGNISEQAVSASKKFKTTETSSGYTIVSDDIRFTIDADTAGFSVDMLDIEGNSISCQKNYLRLTGVDNKRFVPHIENIIAFERENCLRKRFKIEGSFRKNDGIDLADFELELTFFSGLKTVKTDVTIKNPRAAEHPGGVWDLGDKASFIFKDLSFISQSSNKQPATISSFKESPESEWRQFDGRGFLLVQHSSGGENWNSSNHMDYRGEVSLGYRGYRGYENDDLVCEGDRATPTVHVESGQCNVTAHILDFWQNFPKAIEIDDSRLVLSLFPEMESYNYELQGGEQKLHTIFLGYDGDRTSLESCVCEMAPVITRDYYVETKVFPYLTAISDNSKMRQMIERGISGENNFFDKREKIDEYGWRNFGEVFADHESHEHKGKEELISHYNNQYDPVFGFIKQYVTTADSRWCELYSQLARHVVDIDIYHTTEDRDEYNGGLFWHTHHYLSAFTCTHRTFSKSHAEDFIYGEIGGGPGAEHCYTTGLSYLYFMTGDSRYKEAVLQLAGWIELVFEGSGTILERLFQFKNKDLPNIKRLLSGETVQGYKYPFTRGTGNYITTMLDAYNVTGDRYYISRVEDIIQKSIHPCDDIKLRNLKDTEFTWSYLVYLQSICKYIDMKLQLGELDEACLYAKDSLEHYTQWMLENEKPFLEAPDKLEYVNHTWVAQDLRKANLFYLVSQYTDKCRDKYLEAARYYTAYVEDALIKEETRYYSRILILLMQNYVDEASLDNQSTAQVRELDNNNYSSPPLLSLFGIVSGFTCDMVRRVGGLSFSKEKRWLSFRVK